MFKMTTKDWLGYIGMIIAMNGMMLFATHFYENLRGLIVSVIVLNVQVAFLVVRIDIIQRELTLLRQGRPVVDAKPN